MNGSVCFEIGLIDCFFSWSWSWIVDCFLEEKEEKEIDSKAKKSCLLVE